MWPATAAMPMSFHNHATGLKDFALAAFDAAGLSDETIARAYPRVPADPVEYFSKWLRVGAVAGQSDGYQFLSFFEFQRACWAERRRPNVLHVHYNDLKSDLDGEMRWIAAFLDMPVNEEAWPALVQAAGFEAMKRQGAELMPGVTSMFEGGAGRFFNKAENGRWRGVLKAEDLELFDKKMATLPEDCQRWLEGGRLQAGDPRR